MDPIQKYNHLEIARIIGAPIDPRRPYPLLISEVCETDSAAPEDYTYYFDVLDETDIVYVTTTGGITPTAVTRDTPTELTFIDLISPEYYIKVVDLTRAKEDMLARKKKTINRAMNAYENYSIIQLINTACTSEGNTVQLSSGELHFNFRLVIELIEKIIDYSTDYVLIAGTQIDKDIKLFDWTDNKYHSTIAAFKDLGISVIRINQTVTIDGSSTSVLGANTAYMVGRNTEEPGKPLLFVRKRLDAIERLGGVIQSAGEGPERLVFVSPNPVHVNSTHYLAVGITGFEEYAAVTTNPKALVKFTRQT